MSNTPLPEEYEGKRIFTAWVMSDRPEAYAQAFTVVNCRYGIVRNDATKTERQLHDWERVFLTHGAALAFIAREMRDRASKWTEKADWYQQEAARASASDQIVTIAGEG